MDPFKSIAGIFKSGVESVQPENLFPNHLSLKGDLLTCNGTLYRLNEFENILVAGFGKAAASMALEMEKLLGDRIKAGHILTKYGHSVTLKKITTTEAGHPTPDGNGLTGTLKLAEMVRQATSRDLIVVLISGGGSSLLTDLPEGITLENLALTNKVLVNSGAEIQEINAVRKHLSGLKGGQLARLGYPAALLTLIISDVTGDPLDAIASGPTVADPTTFEDALQVVEKYRLQNLLPSVVLEHLKQGKTGQIPETVKEGDSCLLNTRNVVLGSNMLALLNAKNTAEMMGYETTIVSDSVTGEVSEVAEYIFSCVKGVSRTSSARKAALLFGGEPTVQPMGNGLGGRNQHLALLMARKLAGTSGICFLSGGTDGTDGPTDAAGAMCDGSTLEQALVLGIDPDKMIRNFDSYHFFSPAGRILKTGPTRTNVMDIMIVLIGKPE